MYQVIHSHFNALALGLCLDFCEITGAEWRESGGFGWGKGNDERKAGRVSAASAVVFLDEFYHLQPIN